MVSGVRVLKAGVRMHVLDGCEMYRYIRARERRRDAAVPSTDPARRLDQRLSTAAAGP